MNSETDRSSLTRFAWLSIATAVLTIGLKLVAYQLTGSVGLLSEGADSFRSPASSSNRQRDDDFLDARRLWTPHGVLDGRDNIGSTPHVASIGPSAFAECISLTSVTFPEKITSIRSFMFNSCVALTNITIPNSVTKIEDGAFSRCTRLASITIPSSVTHIGAGAFLECADLAAVYFQGNAPTVGNELFGRAQFGPTQSSPEIKATVYYLPGTKGWGASLGGRPTMLRKPQVPDQ